MSCCITFIVGFCTWLWCSMCKHSNVLVSGKRTVATQSQTTYRHHTDHPRFAVLPEGLQGVFETTLCELVDDDVKVSERLGQ